MTAKTLVTAEELLYIPEEGARCDLIRGGGGVDVAEYGAGRADWGQVGARFGEPRVGDGAWDVFFGNRIHPGA